ncbi:MAG: anti-sigma factor antagonist [Phycisphaerales bacterium]|nr:anti-sigma factor antagonist [Phycisphaerales bacterium]
MDIDIRSVEDATVVAIAGDLDTSTSRTVMDRTIPLAESSGRLILDLSRVGYMSSAGLRVVLSLYRRVSSQGGDLVLVGVADEIRDTMEITGFLDYFSTHETIDEAIRALRR